MRLQILCFNIHKGYSLYNQKYVLHQLREALHSLEPDVVLLQEIKGQHPKEHLESDDGSLSSQFEYLADELWPHYAYGRNSVHLDGDHGNAILSKFPIYKSYNLDISTNPIEKRGLLHATVELPDGKDLHLLTTHLNLHERGRAKQMRKIAEYMGAHIDDNAAVVLAGDFNDWRQNICQMLERRMGLYDMHHTLNGARAKTYPNFRPLLRLDRIYVSGLTPCCVKVLDDEPWCEMSDHLALWGEVAYGATEA